MKRRKAPKRGKKWKKKKKAPAPRNKTKAEKLLDDRLKALGENAKKITKSVETYFSSQRVCSSLKTSTVVSLNRYLASIRRRSGLFIQYSFLFYVKNLVGKTFLERPGWERKQPLPCFLLSAIRCVENYNYTSPFLALESSRKSFHDHIGAADDLQPHLHDAVHVSGANVFLQV